MGKDKLAEFIVSKEEWTEAVVNDKTGEQVTNYIGKIKKTKVVAAELDKKKPLFGKKKLTASQTSLNSGESMSDVDDILDTNRTALHNACEAGNLKVVQVLVKNGASTSIQDDEGCIPLHYAILNLHVDIFNFLVVKSDVTITDKSGRNALILASFVGSSQMIGTLTTQKVDLSIGDSEGNTPLHFAAYYGHLEAIKSLLNFAKKKKNTAELLSIKNQAGELPVNSTDSEEIQALLLDDESFERFQKAQKEKKRLEEDSKGKSRVLVDNESLYILLGVDKDITPNDLNRAYKKLALKYHPDRNRDADPAYFMKLSHAYELLSKPDQRAAYDAGGMSKVEDLKFESKGSDADEEAAAKKQDEAIAAERRKIMLSAVHYNAEQLEAMNESQLRTAMNDRLINTAEVTTKMEMINAIMNAQLDMLTMK